MKKLVILFLISSHVLLAQDPKPESKLKVFKFNPLGLISSSLSFGVESFNVEKTRSTVVNFGMRYRKNSNDYFGQNVNGQGVQIDQFSDYKGIMLGVERRMYVPAMRYYKDRLTNELKPNSFGVYFAPAVRFDFNQNHFDKSYYNVIYNSTPANSPNYAKIANSGKVNYASFMPSMNIGFQFTFLQYAYIDAQLGGGLRFQKINEVERSMDGSFNGYSYSDSNAITEILLKEGVRPSGSITLGLKI